MAVVRIGPVGGAGWRPGTLVGSAGGRGSGKPGYRPIPHAETDLRTEAPFGRKRPCALEPHCWATLLPPDQFSFPSGHTITAFAVAVSLGVSYPAIFPGLLFCAASVALSRILLGMHFLSDVIAGALLGASLGYASVTLFRALLF